MTGTSLLAGCAVLLRPVLILLEVRGRFLGNRSPLHALTRKNVRIFWDISRCQESFEVLKEKLMRSAELALSRNLG